MEAKAKKNTKKTIVVIIILVLLVVVGIGSCSIMKAKKTEVQQIQTDAPGDGLVIEENVSDGKLEEKPAEARPNIVMPGWGEVVIEADSEEVTVDFFNPEDNKDEYYMSFELLLEDGDDYESLYQSGLVEPGKHIQKIRLSRPLEAGEYPAVVHIQPYTMEDTPSPTNNGDVRINLIAQ